jgi:peptidoglycan/xylan/chitin deacetylase (PgdA/CDA1 family)
VTFAFKSLVKQSLLKAGHYSRELRRTKLPGVAVLCYHGVRDDRLPPGSIPFQYLHIPASTFESHCRLVRQCCDPISLDDWRAAVDGRSTLPDRPVLITFDDGYRSVLTLGAPILANYRLPAAVFVCTGPMVTRRRLWFDDVAEREGEDAVEAWKSRDHEAWRASCASTSALYEGDPRALMTPAELGKLACAGGIEIGGHTVGHPILARAPASRQRQEIEENLKSIRQWTGKPVRAFAYPNGRPGLDYDADTMSILREAGIDIAFTTRSDFARPDEPLLERSRFLMLDEVSDGELAHRLTYSWPR